MKLKIGHSNEEGRAGGVPIGLSHVLYYIQLMMMMMIQFSDTHVRVVVAEVLLIGCG